MTGESLQARLMAAFPDLTEDDFAHHATDLYVVASPKVCNWLRMNYEFNSSIQFFTSQTGSNWNGAGKRCLDIPFAGNWPKAVTG